MLTPRWGRSRRWRPSSAWSSPTSWTARSQDDGGNKDVLDLGRFYRSSDFALSKGYTNLYMDGPGNNDISIEGFFTTGSGSADSVDKFKFSDKTLSARQVKEMIV